MIIGRDLTDENKYLNNTIKKIRELLDSYGVSSKEQDKEIRRLKEENEFLEEASAFFAASRRKSAKNRD